MKRNGEILVDEKSHSDDERLTHSFKTGSVCLLTVAERKILGCVSRAKTNKEIASDLSISPATVKRHLENILRKLGLRNRVEAAIFGVMMGGCSEASSGCKLVKWWSDRAAAPRSGDSWAI